LYLEKLSFFGISKGKSSVISEIDGWGLYSGVGGVGVGGVRNTKLAEEPESSAIASRLYSGFGVGGVGVDGTSTLVDSWMSWSDVEAFYKTTPTNLNMNSLELIRSWYEECVRVSRQYKTSAIEDIANEHTIKFDFVLIDGSPFSGQSELKCVRPFLTKNAIIALDDINDIKNYANYQELKTSSTLLWENWSLRNGAAIFQLTL
jgi:hypothetical protein